jgi:hypothetical protein
VSERKRPRGAARGGGTRGQIAREAAEIMLREDVKQYFDAKRIAARRVLDGGRYRAQDLPSNGEIRAALLDLVQLSEGPDRERLFAMRAEALAVMRALEAWEPRLIGSVWSGHVRRGSDIDLHVFGEVDAIRADLDGRRWPYEHAEVLIRKGGEFRLYHHLHLLGRVFPVELSVVPSEERHLVTRSSVDGRPIDRVSASRLEARLQQEHAFAFARWERTGEVEFEEGPEPGPFDGLLR